MSDLAFALLVNEELEGDELARFIATCLRSHIDRDPLFFKHLAEMIDPDKKSPFPFKLEVRRARGGNPKKKPNYRLAVFMVEAVDERKLSLKEAIHQAQIEFAENGKKPAERTCIAALSRGREYEKIQRQLDEENREMDADMPRTFFPMVLDY
jgi:hypothetical protein